jgi:hypothetical protein
MTDTDLKGIEEKLDMILELLRDLRPKKAREVALKNNILRVISEKNIKGHVREDHKKASR